MNILLKLFIFITLSYGISNIIVFSHLFDTTRNFIMLKAKKSLYWSKIYDLITCMMCLPTWIGFFLSAFSFILLPNNTFTPFGILIDNPNTLLIPIFIFFDGVIASGCVWLIHTLQEFFEKK